MEELKVETTRFVKDVFKASGQNIDSDSGNRSLPPLKRRKTVEDQTVEWIKYPNSVSKSGHFKYARVGNLYINQGDHIVIGSDEASKPSRIGYVVYMFEGEDGEKMAHVGFYERGTDTIMGDTSDPRELFLVHGCVDLYLSAISSKAKVVRRYVNRELWKNNGGNKRPFKNDDGVSYYFSKICDSDRSRFLDIVDDKTTECISCAWQKETDSRDAPKLTTDKRCFEWQGVIYSVGSAVFFESGDYRENEDPDKSENKENEYRFESINGEWLNTCKLDREAIFPERYRKPGKKCSTEFSEPYTIGIIEDIKDGRVVNITIRMFYRPEDLVDGKYGDPHLLYWTNRFYTIKGWSQWKDVAKGKCFVAKKTLLPNCDEWIKEGPYRFYFEKFYDHKKNIVLELPIEDKKPGGESKDTQNEEILVWPKLNRKLRSMDIYAGCGGLSNGLEKSGLVVTKWAIEKDKSASKSFRLNNPTATVIKGDCNKILSNLLLKLDTVGMPEKGEVDIIVGGPPCQGYSKMNRHNQKAPAKKNNSQVLNFLGFVDYYRPDYFIFENVENFVKFEDSLHLKLTIKCALRIGYQIAFGILDAGNYGLPQKRRRFFIVGAAPFLKLPNLPEPTHCFINKSRLNFKVDNKVYDTGETATGARGSLPYRNVTVRDAIADLPVLDDNAKSKDKKHQIPIEEDKAKRYEMEYDNRQPLSHYVRLLRQHVKRDDVVTCHQFTPLSSIMRKRIELIPENGNWMDLPNITVTLKNNVKTDILNYSFRNVAKALKVILAKFYIGNVVTSEIGSLHVVDEVTSLIEFENQKDADHRRAMCPCFEGDGSSCSDDLRKSNTLIPWSVAHTAEKNNNWRNVYGRLSWDGCFATVTTTVQPMRAQGKVLHPNQNRLISVRECARAQGFPDDFHFRGCRRKRYMQVGNAVPPILATAIGREIVKSLV